MKQYKYIGTTARGDLQVAWTRDIRRILAFPSNRVPGLGTSAASSSEGDGEGEGGEAWLSAEEDTTEPITAKCANPSCNRVRQYEVGCCWDRCCKQGFNTYCREHDEACDRRSNIGQ